MTCPSSSSKYVFTVDLTIFWSQKVMHPIMLVNKVGYATLGAKGDKMLMKLQMHGLILKMIYGNVRF